MKNIFKIIIVLISTTCLSQSPIKDLYDYNIYNTQGTYFKDSQNVLINFEGTYIYTNGTTSLKIVLEKRTMVFDSKCYRDWLVGEYQYIENGVQKVNTLSNLDVSYTYMQQHYISGNSIVKKTGRPLCTDCAPSEKRVRLGFRDPNNTCPASILIRKVMVGNQEALHIRLRDEERSVVI